MDNMPPVPDATSEARVTCGGCGKVLHLAEACQTDDPDVKVCRNCALFIAQKEQAALERGFFFGA